MGNTHVGFYKVPRAGDKPKRIPNAADNAENNNNIENALRKNFSSRIPPASTNCNMERCHEIINNLKSSARLSSCGYGGTTGFGSPKFGGLPSSDEIINANLRQYRGYDPSNFNGPSAYGSPSRLRLPCLDKLSSRGEQSGGGPYQFSFTNAYDPCGSSKYGVGGGRILGSRFSSECPTFGGLPSSDDIIKTNLRNFRSYPEWEESKLPEIDVCATALDTSPVQNLGIVNPERRIRREPELMKSMTPEPTIEMHRTYAGHVTLEPDPMKELGGDLKPKGQMESHGLEPSFNGTVNADPKSKPSASPRQASSAMPGPEARKDSLKIPNQEGGQRLSAGENSTTGNTGGRGNTSAGASSALPDGAEVRKESLKSPNQEGGQRLFAGENSIPGRTGGGSTEGRGSSGAPSALPDGAEARKETLKSPNQEGGQRLSAGENPVPGRTGGGSTGGRGSSGAPSALPDGAEARKEALKSPNQEGGQRLSAGENITAGGTGGNTGGSTGGRGSTGSTDDKGKNSKRFSLTEPGSNAVHNSDAHESGSVRAEGGFPVQVTRTVEIPARDPGGLFLLKSEFDTFLNRYSDALKIVREMNAQPDFRPPPVPRPRRIPYMDVFPPSDSSPRDTSCRFSPPPPPPPPKCPVYVPPSPTKIRSCSSRRSSSK